MISEKKNNNIASLLGSSISGILEISLFHPFDTATKRLISNKSQSTKNLNGIRQVVLREHAHLGWIRGLPHLYPGMGFATSYKISQRVYKYSGQHLVKNQLLSRYGNEFNNTFGKYGNSMISAVSGSMIGVGEIALLPLDILKIKSQTNPESLKGRGFLTILREENTALYSGASWTALRNGIGSFVLFGSSTLLKSQLYNLDINDKASFIASSLRFSVSIMKSLTLNGNVQSIETL